MSINFQIPDMTCGHCVNTITQAITAQYPGANVQADVDTHSLSVTGVEDSDTLQDIIRQEGYSPSLK
ncbi:MAG TPA: heavy-metal-associated domain-containing protein [Paenalcaligenes sp.]|nr:heavy-metal-associated domain-containing protein [Paenalcaligenes sp.]